MATVKSSFTILPRIVLVDTINLSRWNNADTIWGQRLFVGRHFHAHGDTALAPSDGANGGETFPWEDEKFPWEDTMFTNILIFSCLAAQGSHSFVFFLCCTLKQKTKLSCCLSVLCTFGTVKNFKLKCCVKRVLFPTSAGIPPPGLEPASLCLWASPLASYVFPYHMASIVWVRQVRILIEGGYYFIQHRQSFGYLSRAHTIQHAGTIQEIMVLQFWD